ncbi:hypothetical protein MesoLjLc_63960 [Mesorhizobium sp. L-8-10]|uniref:hypothetical protein n=1 Tax=Mesorhizobium sp. L-8-10 TaxID=2744523 RepID=UPI001925C844|nr:hypothetical protein [Mesorhizobium sp. L-8-10]BCH34466.1 hypothetical protein MesoLjLc_63960 [Mesorhizobium sp. L-8-10]
MRPELSEDGDIHVAHEGLASGRTQMCSCGIFTGDLGKALERRDEGYQLVVLASDVDIMRDAFTGATRAFAQSSR